MLMERRPTVFIVDDDECLRDSLVWLVESVGLEAQTFARAKEFLEEYDHGQPGCLVLDLRMPEMSGLELQRILNEREIKLPVIFLTGHGDVSAAVQAMRAGAHDFIEKPASDQLLLDRIQQAITWDASRREREHGIREFKERLATLTRRERQVVEWVASGKANKEIADALGISPKTVEAHRAQCFSKLRVCNLAELVRNMQVVSQT